MPHYLIPKSMHLFCIDTTHVLITTGAINVYHDVVVVFVY